MAAVDSLIIGGGAPGLVCALALAESGRRVLVLDDDNPSATAAAAGILSPLPPWRCAPAAAAMAAAGAAMFPALLKELGDNCDWAQCGMFILPPYNAAALQSWRAGGGKVSAADCPAGVISPAKKVLFLPKAAKLDAKKLLAALRRKLGDRRRVAKVESVTVKDGAASGALLQNGEQIAAGEVVLSAGAWSGALCPPPAPQIFPARGQMLLYPAAASLPGVVLVEAESFYLSPRADGNIIAGSTMEDAGFDSEPTAEGITLLQNKAEKLFPALSGKTPLQKWAGLRPMSKDGAKICRHEKVPGLYLNTGHGRYGLTMSPAAAQKLLQIMDGKE